MEATYPSLGAASDLRGILYRCVRETCNLAGVHNQPAYVDAWLKLVRGSRLRNRLFNFLLFFFSPPHTEVKRLRRLFFLLPLGQW